MQAFGFDEDEEDDEDAEESNDKGDDEEDDVDLVDSDDPAVDADVFNISKRSRLLLLLLLAVSFDTLAVKSPTSKSICCCFTK